MRLALAIAPILLVSACGRSEPVRSVDYYLEHADERKQTIAKCNGLPSRGDQDDNCSNAALASQKATLRSRGSSAVIGLPAPAEKK